MEIAAMKIPAAIAPSMIIPPVIIPAVTAMIMVVVPLREGGLCHDRTQTQRGGKQHRTQRASHVHPH